MACVATACAAIDDASGWCMLSANRRADFPTPIDCLTWLERTPTDMTDLPQDNSARKPRDPSSLRVLVACEYSGRVRDAFIRRGFRAWSCDILPCESDPTNHIRDSVLHLFNRDPWWDLIIAHPPCTYLANSGAKHLYAGMKKGNGINPDRWEQMEHAAEFYVAMLDAPAPHVAVENPIMHGPATTAIRREWTKRHVMPLPPVNYIQPYQHGHGETKATGFRLINLPALDPSNQVEGREQNAWRMGPSPDRWKDRSRTFLGVADAMAQQWGDYILRAA